MIDLIKQLRTAGYLTGILSDQTHWLDDLDARDHFFMAFDRIYNSYYLGKGKQDPDLFSDVANDLGLPTSAILFVDDDAGNVKRARAAGLQAIHYVDQDSLIQEMENRGIGLNPILGSSN
jgi:putative hydrolase of the HAD superfamily